MLSHAFLFYSGGLFLKRLLKPRRFPVVLAYHTIETPIFLQHSIGIQNSKIEFVEQIKYLAGRHPIISMHDLLNWLQNRKSIPPNSILITFDDGYRDVYSVAMPLFKDLGISSTIFLTTGCISQRKSIWTNKLYYLISLCRKKRIEYSSDNATKIIYELGDPVSRMRSAVDLSGNMKKLENASRVEALIRLAEEMDVDPQADPHEELPMLNWDQVKELSESGFNIGSHSMSHPILSKCNREMQFQEISHSKIIIEKEIGCECETFAYPNGQLADYDSVTFELVRESGYKAAFTFSDAFLERSSDPFRIPRRPLFEVPLPSFAKHVI